MHEAVSGLKWTLPTPLCPITAFSISSTIYTSTLLLSAVIVVRYMGVTQPVHYLRLLRPGYAIAISAFIWVISTAHSSINFIIQYHPALRRNNTTVCYENFTEKQLGVLLLVRLETFCVMCLVPLIICVYCYSGCVITLYNRPRIPNMQRKKAISMAIGTLATFLICVLPYNLSHLMGYIQNESPRWRNYTLLLSASNACIDPIIFYFSSTFFRHMTDRHMQGVVLPLSVVFRRTPTLHRHMST